jgi:hypothetical protein
VGAPPAEEGTGVEDCNEGTPEELGVCGEAGAEGDVRLCESGSSEAAGDSIGVDVFAGEGVSAGVGVSTGLTASGGLEGSGLAVSVGFASPSSASRKFGVPPTWDNSVGNKPGKKTDSDGP